MRALGHIGDGQFWFRLARGILSIEKTKGKKIFGMDGAGIEEELTGLTG
jgi:hypothetical protein